MKKDNSDKNVTHAVTTMNMFITIINIVNVIVVVIVSSSITWGNDDGILTVV